MMPNDAGPESRVFTVNIVAAICLPLLVFFGSFRLYAKIVILRSWSWADGMFPRFLLPAVLLTCA